MNINRNSHSLPPAWMGLAGFVARLAAVILTLALPRAHAGSATWASTPFNGDWNNATNWTPATVPNGASDTASFSASNRTNVFVSDFTTVDGIVFEAAANAFTINVGSQILEIVGAGMTNNSGVIQHFLAPVEGVIFFNQATAGSNISFTMRGGYAGSGFVAFEGESTAGSAVYICKGATVNQTQGGYVSFNSGAPSADHGDFTIEGASASGANGGFVVFHNGATAARASFRIGGGRVSGALGGLAIFQDFATAAEATFVNRGGLVDGAGGSRMLFYDNSSGGRARIVLADNSSLDITGHSSPGITTGSVAGNGIITLGANTLAVGKNNLSTIFSGLIEDGQGYSGGSLTKIGTGDLSLISANTYTGRTIVKGGALLVGNTSGSATGSGSLDVIAGTLGGTGIIAGAVSIASDSEAASLSPGDPNIPGPLTIQSAVSFGPLATCHVELNTDDATADELIAHGVTIDDFAQISVNDIGSTGRVVGTVFTIISNSADTPIAGNFGNLIEGSILTVGNNNYRVSYQGGDGNDLTFTVVD